MPICDGGRGYEYARVFGGKVWFINRLEGAESHRPGYAPIRLAIFVSGGWCLGFSGDGNLNLGTLLEPYVIAMFVS